MNLYKLTNIIKDIARGEPNVNTSFAGDIYQLNSMPCVEYSVFCVTQGQHRCDDEYRYYQYTLFYVDREISDESNKLDVESIGIEILDDILNKLEDNFGVIVQEHQFQPFTESFADLCAGVFVTVVLQVPIGCHFDTPVIINPKMESLYVTENGDYYPKDFEADGFSTVHVSVVSQDCEEEIRRLQGIIEEKEREIETQKGDIDTLKAEIDALKARISELEAEIERLNGIIADKDNEINSLNEEVERLLKALGECRKGHDPEPTPETGTTENQNVIYHLSDGTEQKYYFPDGIVQANINPTLHTKTTGVTIGDSINEIGNRAFANHFNISHINLGKVKVIGDSAFDGTQNLTTIHLPETIEYLDDACFCMYNTDIYCHSVTPPEMHANALMMTLHGGTWHAPIGSDYSVLLGDRWFNEFGWTLVYDI